MRFGLSSPVADNTPVTGDFSDQFTKLTRVRRNGIYKYLRPKSYSSEIDFKLPQLLEKDFKDTPMTSRSLVPWNLNLNLNLNFNMNFDVGVIREPTDLMCYMVMCLIVLLFIVCFVIAVLDYMSL